VDFDEFVKFALKNTDGQPPFWFQIKEIRSKKKINIYLDKTRTIHNFAVKQLKIISIIGLV